MKCVVVVVLIGVAIFELCQGQRIPLPTQTFLNNQNQPQPQNASGGPPNINMQVIQQQQKSDELANIKDEGIKRVLLELSTLQTPSQMSDTMARVAALVGPLFVSNFDARKDQITTQSRDPSVFPQRLLSAVTDIQGEEIKALVLQRKLDTLHASDFAFLPLAIQYGLQEDVVGNLSGTKLASLVKANPGDTVVATKVSMALLDQPEQQMEFLQSLGTKLLPNVQRIIMRSLLEWWGDPHDWKDRELSLLITSGNPLLAYMPQSELQTFDDELADRFVTMIGQTQDIARGWWRKPMSLKKAWFDLAKGARYFGAVHEWSFRRMQKLSFLLEGATPEDLELIPPVPEIKGLVIGNHYTELQARVVFDAFYHTPPLSQEDLQEFQFHVLDLIPSQLQRFDFADSFGTLDEMLSILDRQQEPSYPTVLQISYFMWPIVNTSNSVMNIAPPSSWQKRELSQIGKMFFLLPKSVMSQIKPDLINWDSNILGAIRSNHLSQFQIWKLASQILPSVDERLRPDYIFMIPPPFQKGIPTHNISQALLGTTTVRPEILRALIEETSGMLISQKSVILQRIQNRMSESIIIRMMISTSNPAEMFDLISSKILSKNMPNIIKTIMEMPETGRFGLTSIQTKLLPQTMLSLWLKWVRENSQVARWTAEDLLGRSSIGMTNELNYAILGLSCRDIEIVDPWDILSVIMHYRHELYALRKFEPSLSFNVNLRSCVFTKFIEYMKQKHFLDEDQTGGHVLMGITDGEIDAIGGEILSIIPTQALERLEMDLRESIIKEIGKLDMEELFSLVPLENLHWYATTLFRDIEISASNLNDDSNLRKRRQLPPMLASPANTTSQNSTDTVASAPTDATTRAIPTDQSHTTGTTKSKGVNTESLSNMGNLLCYADNLFDTTWPKSLLKDVLEAKTSVGEKTCCLSKVLREKWFETLKAVYGSDTSSWNEFDLTAIGDLLITLPEPDLLKISTDSLGKATTPMLRQSAYALKIRIPGQMKKIQFVTACSEALGTEGMDFMVAYKRLMKRLFQASQWMVNTVKTTQELIRDGLGRTGRIPRWAEHTLVKRQVPLTVSGGELSYTGTAATAPATAQIVQVPSQQVFPQQTFAVQTTPGSQIVGGLPVQTFAYISQPGQQFVQPGQVFAQPQQMVYVQQGQTFVPTTVVDPSQFGSGTIAATGASAGAGGASATGVAGSGGGGSFSGSFAQANANSGNANAGAAGFSGGTDPTQTSGVGSFSQANANTNTFATRATGNQPPQQQPQAAPGQPMQQQQQQNPTSPGQQQQNPTASGQQPQQNPSVSGQQPQNVNPNLPTPNQQQAQNVPNPPIQNAPGQPSQTGPGQQQVAPTGQQQPGSVQQPPVNAPSQQQPGSGQQQPISAPGQQQPGTGLAQPGSIPVQQPASTPPQQQQPSGAIQPQQSGPGQPQGAGQLQQLQTRNAPNQPQPTGAQTQPTQQQNIAGQAVGPGSVPPQQTQQVGGIIGAIQPQQQQPGAPQQPQQQQPGAPQQQMQPSQGGIPSQSMNQPMQPGTTGSIPGLGGRAGDADNLQQSLNQPILNQQQQFGSERERSLSFGPLQDDTHTSEITCHGVKAAGSAAIGLQIEDLNKLSQADLFDCVEALGRIEWDEDIKSSILTLLKQKLDFSQDSINSEILIEMGDLVTAFSADSGTTGFSPNTSTSTSTPTVHSDVSMIDLTLPNSLDILSILGRQITNPALLKSLAEKFNQDNRIFPGFSEGIARPENLRIVVMSLGNVICGLSDKIVNSIFETDASLFIDTSRILGRLEGCSPEVLTTLSAHAVRPSNYGPPRLWSQEDVETVGVVFAGLKPEVISTIPADAMQGLSPLAVKNLPAPSLLAFTTEQLSKISYHAAKAFTPAQFNNFSPAEAQAIQSVFQVQTEAFNIPISGQDDQEVVRSVGDTSVDSNNTQSVGGRAKDGKGDGSTIVVVDVVDGNSTSNTDSTDKTTSSAISSKFKSFGTLNLFYGPLLVALISVIQIVNF